MLKRIGLLLLQFAVTAAGLYYVFRNPHQRALIADALRHSDWHWLLLSWICYGLVEGLATVRWQMLLRIQGITLAWWRAGVIVVIGLFFNMFLPGLIGGDAMRLYFVFKEAPRKKTRATLSVAMDRLMGLLSIFLLAILVVTLRFSWLNHFPDTAHITYVALALLGASALFALLVLGGLGLGLLGHLPKKFPFREGVLQARNALRLYGARPWICFATLGLTIISHAAYYLSYYCAAGSLHQSTGHVPSLLDFASIMPLVNTITGVPISFGGVGVRENLFQKLLGDLTGLPAAVAALAASLGYLIQASWGVLGGVAYLLIPFGRRKDGRQPITVK